MTLEEDIDLILFYFAEAGFDVELDKEWMQAAYRAEQHEERSNRTYYERIEPWDGTKTLIDPKSVSRIIDTIDLRSIMRLKSFRKYLDNHAPTLAKPLSVVLKNGAQRRCESYWKTLRTIIEEEILRRSKRSLRPQRSRPRLRWRASATRRTSKRS